MAKYCFCGCERKVPFGRGAMNTSGARVTAALAELEGHADAMRHVGADNVDDFLGAGRRWKADLAAIVHREIDPRDVDVGDMRRWLRTAWQSLPSARVISAGGGRAASDE